MCRCIRKFRNKSNVIIGYRLIDDKGKTLDINAQALKTAMRNKAVEISNLSLTADNRIISLDIKDNYKKHSKTTDNNPFRVTQELIDSLHVDTLKFRVIMDDDKLRELSRKIKSGTLSAQYDTKILSEDIFLIRKNSIGEIISGRELIIEGIPNRKVERPDIIDKFKGYGCECKLIGNVILFDLGEKTYLCIEKSSDWMNGNIWIQWRSG